MWVWRVRLESGLEWVSKVRGSAAALVESCERRSRTAVAAAHDPRFISVSWRATCDVPIAMLTLDFTGFFAVDTRHQAIVRVLTPHGDPYEVAVRAEDPPLNLSVGAAPPSSWLAWIRIGMGHIYDGRDHISFVLALLLVVGLRRNDDGTWASRSLGASLRATATTEAGVGGAASASAPLHFISYNKIW